MNRILRVSLALTTVFAVAGCGIFLPTARDRAAKNTPGFKSGYSDGCASASAQNTKYRNELVRDEQLYQSDKHYRSGWASGFSNCRAMTHQGPVNPNAGPIPDNRPGSH